MANRVAKHKISAVAKSLKENKTYAQSLRENGYSKDTANQGIHNKVIQEALLKNSKDFLKEDVTPEYVIGNLREVRELAKGKKDYSTALQADIALGKIIALFTDKVRTEGSSITPQLEQELRNYIQGNRLGSLS